MSKDLTLLSGPLAIALGAWCSYQLNQRMLALDTAFIEPPATIEQAPDPRLIQIASLGHTPSWVDAIVIRSMGDPAYDPVLPGTHPPLYFELLVATALDPDFAELYSYGASLLSVVRRDGPGAAELLERAHQQILQGRLTSQAVFLEIFRGYNALFETRDLAVAQDAFATAAGLPGAPPHLKALAARLSTPEGRFEVAARAFDSLLKRKNDDETRKVLETRWNAILLARRLFEVNREFGRWLGKRPATTESFWVFQKTLGTSGVGLRWDPMRGQVETLAEREIVPGFY